MLNWFVEYLTTGTVKVNKMIEVTVILEDHGADETLMTIEHEQLPPEEVDSHQRGWGAIAVQLGEALSARG